MSPPSRSDRSALTGYDEGRTGSDDLVGFLVAVAFVEPLFPFFTRMLAEITPRVKDLAGVWLAHALASRQGWSTNTSEWSSNLN